MPHAPSEDQVSIRVASEPSAAAEAVLVPPPILSESHPLLAGERKGPEMDRAAPQMGRLPSVMPVTMPVRRESDGNASSEAAVANSGDLNAGLEYLSPAHSGAASRPTERRPLAEYDHAARKGAPHHELPHVRDYLNSADYFRVKDGQASGDTRTVSERHLSFLLREWEVTAAYAPSRAEDAEGGEVYANPAAVRHPIAPGKPQGLLILIAAAVFTLSFVIGMYASDGMPIAVESVLEITMISLFITHVLIWLLVFVSSDFAQYRSWSLVDGWNTITRMTLKMGLEDRHSTFAESRMPSSISSSVATRGTTLNKLMIGVAYSLGVGLFVKFMWLNSWHGTLTAIGYLMILATALYENTQYDMDDVTRSMPQPDGKGHIDVPKPMGDHRMSYVELLHSNSRGRITFDDQLPVTTGTFAHLHGLGVVGFVVLSFVGHTVRRFNHSPLVLREESVWVVSLAGLILGITFVVLNWDLSLGKVSCCGGKASRRANKYKGLLCILIELSALALATTAGLLYNVPNIDIDQ